MKIVLAWGSRKRHIFIKTSKWSEQFNILCKTQHKEGYSTGGHYCSYEMNQDVFKTKKEDKDTKHTHTEGIIEFKPLEVQGIIESSICKKCLRKYKKLLVQV